MKAPFFGITVMPEYIQYEGIEPLLDNLVRRAGVTAVATSPYVMAPSDEASGTRKPTADGGAGKVRLLDRPLWGRRDLYVRTAPSFAPDRSLYAGLRYQPAAPDALTEAEGRIVGRFIAAARPRGLEAHLQVQAAIPPGCRVQFGGPADDDLPRLPDGRAPGLRVNKTGSLASPHILDYGCALIRDLVRAHPEIDGLRVDWPEHPPYTLDAIFTDFGPHAEGAAAGLGLDFARMRDDALRLYRVLHGGLQERHLWPWLGPDGGRDALLRLLAAHPGIGDWLRFKAMLVERLLARYRVALDEAGGGRVRFLPQGLPASWSLVSGFDFSRVARHCHAMPVKAANPRLDERLLGPCLLRWLDVQDADAPPSIDSFAYLAPDERHPAGAAAASQDRAGAGRCGRYAGARDRPRLRPAPRLRGPRAIAWEASGRRIWVNRYGYLSDAKLDALGALPRG